MAAIYNNVPKDKSSSSSDQTVQVFNQYYQTPVSLNNNDLIAMTGFFEKRGFGTDAAESTALVILQQAKKDGFSAMQVMDTLAGLSPVEISALVAEILNYNRFKTSALGTSQHYAPSEEVLRNVEGHFATSRITSFTSTNISTVVTTPTTSTNTSTNFNVLADYIVIEYQFSDGADLDTRTRLAVPSGSPWVGWGQSSNFGSILTWGGDNTGNGYESAVLDITNFKSEYPAVSNITVDCRAQWYSTNGVSPVALAVTLYTGGSPVLSGFDWTNPTATSSTVLATVSKVIELHSNDPGSDGERVGVLQYNVLTGAGSLVTNDLTDYP